MARKVWNLIKKPTTTTDHDAHPYSLLNILLRYDHEKKIWLAIGPAQWAAEKAAKAAKELELPKAKEQEAVVVLVNGFKEATKDHHHHQLPAVTNESSSSDYSSSSSPFESKVNATKRKLHDTQLANAKKRRKIQVIDPCDLPPTQSSSPGAACSKATVVAARKKITTNKKTRNNNNNNLLTYESTNFYFLKISNRIHAVRKRL